MAGLFDELQWRGLVHQVTDPELPKLLDHDSLAGYIGFDPTADSLHVGSLLQLCNLRRFQEAGHRPIALAGGGTGMIGDPSGKSEERSLLTQERLEANLAAIRSQLARFVDFDRGGLLVDNGEWLWSVGLLEFLRDVGKHFTVNQMVAKESVRARLEEREQGISYTEFSYMLLQAYDFLHLFDAHGCRLQMGASDQWGNITMGCELIRKLRGETAYGLTTPLVVKADGTKFGKTESGTVWLDPDKTSPYAFYQFFVRSEDAVVGQYLRYFTWLSREEIEALDTATAERPERREAQRALAREVTALVHGADEAERAERAAIQFFVTEDLSRAQLEALALDSSARRLSFADLEPGLPLPNLLALVGLAASRSEARERIKQGAVEVNQLRISNPERLISRSDLMHDRYLVLRTGSLRTVVMFEEGIRTLRFQTQELNPGLEYEQLVARVLSAGGVLRSLRAQGPDFVWTVGNKTVAVTVKAGRLDGMKIFRQLELVLRQSPDACLVVCRVEPTSSAPRRVSDFLRQRFRGNLGVIAWLPDEGEPSLMRRIRDEFRLWGWH